MAESVIFGRARVVILVGDRVLGHGVLCELLHSLAWLAATSTSTAPAPPPAFSTAGFAFALDARFGFGFGCNCGYSKFRLLRKVVSFGDFVLDFFDRRGAVAGRRPGRPSRVRRV